jgi:hypothetical protein
VWGEGGAGAGGAQRAGVPCGPGRGPMRPRARPHPNKPPSLSVICQLGRPNSGDASPDTGTRQGPAGHALRGVAGEPGAGPPHNHPHKL